MNVQIPASDFSLTNGLRESIAWRTTSATNHARPAASRVAAHLSEVNGPRGGMDKRCGVEVRLKADPSLVVEEVQTDLYVAIDRSFERVGRSLHRRLARRRDFITVSPAHHNFALGNP